ncbi:MAG TPA: TlpA disulfide reductase family protein [Opitutaceae bacterium]
MNSASNLRHPALLLAIAAILFTGASLAAAEGAAAPAWKLKDVDGNVVSSESLAGKVVVVDFWATWCPPCREEIPGYIKMQKKHGNSGLVIIGISLDAKGPAVVKPFMEKFGMNYIVVMGDDAVADAFGGVEAIPTTFVIGRDGRIAYKKIGYEAHDEFEKHVLPLL